MPAMNRLTLASVLVLFGVAVCHASGSYVPRPPRHVSKADRKGTAIDSERYGVGRAIVLSTGEVTLPKSPDASLIESQRQQLLAVDATLTEEVRRKARLSELAGRLTPAQLDSVVFYLGVRFPPRQAGPTL